MVAGIHLIRISGAHIVKPLLLHAISLLHELILELFWDADQLRVALERLIQGRHFIVILLCCFNRPHFCLELVHVTLFDRLRHSNDLISLSLYKSIEVVLNLRVHNWSEVPLKIALWDGSLGLTHEST